MDTLESMRVFVRVVENGSFAAAARGLDLSPAMVSKHIAHLEQRTGARLLNRTTRQVRATEAGATYFDRCCAILRSVEAAEVEAGADTSAPRGTLRITAPTEFGNLHLPTVIARFLERYPGIDFALDLTNRSVDIVQEGYDLAIRVARTLEASLIGRRIALSRFHIVASPAYLKREGHPIVPAELSRRPCLVFCVPQPWTTWSFRHGGEAQEVKVAPRMLSTSAEALLQAACAGAGVGLLPTFVCGEALARGELVSLFPECECGVLGIHILFPHRSLMPARVRLFIDFLVESIGGGADRDPWEPARVR